jgi:hypothetical protein
MHIAKYVENTRTTSTETLKQTQAQYLRSRAHELSKCVNQHILVSTPAVLVLAFAFRDGLFLTRSSCRLWAKALWMRI